MGAGHLPRTIPPYIGSPTDMGTDEPNPPFSHGTVGRYTATVGSAAPPGLYKLEFVPGMVSINNNAGDGYCGGGWPEECTVKSGLIAVGQACPVSVGGIAELPHLAEGDPLPRNYAALAGAVAAALAFTAGAWYARRRGLTRRPSRR